METRDVHELSERFTVLSDRFRSLWTFFQFLAGVYKHRGEGQIPYQYDFHALYKRIQDLVPNIRGEISKLILVEFEQIERELERIQRNLESLDGSFPPSYLRRFFDHLKRQDEKILFALVKFYLMSQELDQETLDKLDILLTRLAEVPAENGELMHRSPSELLPTYKRLAKFAGLTPLPSAEEKPYVEGMAQIREEFDRIGDFDTLVQSKIYDRLRGFKTRIGRDMLHPAILVEVTAANIAARNRFRELFEIEERQLRDGTNRILEIERYLEKNPGLASENIKQKIEAFRRSQLRFEKGLRQDNVKRSDILELRQSMHAVLAQFEATAADPLGDFEDPPPPSVMLRVPRWSDASAGDESAPSARDTSAEAPTSSTL